MTKKNFKGTDLSYPLNYTKLCFIPLVCFLILLVPSLGLTSLLVPCTSYINFLPLNLHKTHLHLKKTFPGFSIAVFC